MNYIVMHETVTNHDAIGNDIEIMFNILNETDHCVVYARNRFNDAVKYISEKILEAEIARTDTVLIYHHSVYWEYGFKILQTSKCKIIIRYHNITPASFFQEYNLNHYNQCSKGRELTERMIKEIKNAFWLCDSVYNASELNLPEQQIGICPPFNKIEEWDSVIPNENILKQLVESDTINLLWVGRVVPNKGHLQAFEIIHRYCICYDKRIKLRIIGKFDKGLEGYNQKIKGFIREHNISSNVEFIGETSDEDLLAYYLGSDLMLCCSQHEGFCVPIIEAQHFGLPVIALKTTAVSETMGKDQVCLDNDCSMFVAAIRVIMRNKNFYHYLCKKGYDNYDNRFSHTAIKNKFLSELEGMLKK